MGRDDIQHHPFLSLALSLIPLSLAVYGTITGTAVLRNAKVERAKNPVGYWFLLALEYGFFALMLSIAISNWP